jgi:glycosyltransferase involved in cell wall biosynthesis
MLSNQKIISVIVPVYFQEKGLLELYKRLEATLSKLDNIDYEIILVNDGSTDKSFEIMKFLNSQNPKVKIINFSRNFNQQMAITAGLDHSIGDAVVVIDDDLQDPPEVIPTMIEKWKEGYKVVYAVRSKRKGESFFKKVTANLFYRIIDRLSDIKLPRNAGDFRLMDRAVVDILKQMKEESRYLRGMVTWIGFSQYALEYERDPRFIGKTNYNLKSLVRLALNGLTSFSEKPLLISGFLGLIITIVSFLFLMFVLILRIINPQSTIQGWTSLVAIVIFFGGIQLLSIGIIGLYTGKIYRALKNRPFYVIEEKYGFNDGKK